MRKDQSGRRGDVSLSLAAMCVGAAVFWMFSEPLGPGAASAAAPAPPPSSVVSPVALVPMVPDSEISLRPETPLESNVSLGLKWLTAHQGRYGLWGDAETTGIALLAFHGAGETARSGAYRVELMRAWTALVELQGPDGAIASGWRSSPLRRAPTTLRAHAIAGLALVEHFGITGSPGMKAPAQAAVAFALKTRSRGGGWVVPESGELDVETSAWMSMLLKSGALGGLDVDATALGEVAAEFERRTDPTTGRVTVPASQRERVSDDAATAMSLLVRQFAGRDTSVDPLAAKSAAALAANPPSAATTDLSYVHFGVCAMFRVEDGWKPWSQGFTAFAQSPPDSSGSWAVSPGASERDRIWTTAHHLFAAECFYGAVGHSRRKR